MGCVNCSGPHLTKDYNLDENENRKAKACYLSGDRYDEDWRRPKKEWLPYDEYKKANEEKYRQQGHGFYQMELPAPEKKNDFEAMLSRFEAASEKRHDDTDM